MAELDEFARHYLVETVYARDAVANGDDGTDFAHVNGAVVVLDLLAENRCNFVCPNLSHKIDIRLTQFKQRAGAGAESPAVPARSRHKLWNRGALSRRRSVPDRPRSACA